VRLIIPFCFSLIFLGISCKPKASCGEQTFNNTQEYLGYIQKQQNKIDSAMLNLSRSFETGSEKNIRLRYQQLLNICDTVLLETRNLTGYNSDESVKKATWSLFSFYNDIFHQEYQELLEILLSEQLPGNEEHNRASVVLEKVKLREDSLKKSLSDSLALFVERNK
jgi:hypothetical protein